mmetsp:Transcript_7791/g.9873  ORF Transcript_7791/g.9873 Transcript_7791/m.9873 type:complete len:210 (+) Transcript_7791:150-779(+)|eukprot:CAMPEP_0204871150 /NCGR_PEP_ID=MMETSP1348-20121228/34442_1 /ASSEMBLY_ACC=CAM_ASM_000700 /TAXON_ID=215587 /ORGANISM="Aplanochytrium stocchinoi, Strain GSBS06" /LENGTH=209 /DNA_ID=CAMNT_0052025289 /DNA_START=526 /DNA_END=1155 /DNA_ORIENTATION=+
MGGSGSKRERRAQQWINKVVNKSAGTQNNRTIFDAPYKIMDHLYLGNMRHAADVRQLHEYGITHVINCAGGDSRVVTNRKMYPKFIQGYYEVPGVDSTKYNMMQHFNEIYYLIEDARRNNGRVLVHCMQGVNRSGLMVIAYCLAANRWNLEKAVTHCVEVRGLILLNVNFQNQLVKFARKQKLLKGNFSKKNMPGLGMPSSEQIATYTL